ncbi:PQQ-dependent sugar dehydrogenase [Salinarimonas ramus]|uniref:Sorbosone dehydrogenase n=1 Tax=Salinarimonas ramus TaxID=690164 RepID=A0A917V488_9HYPH|nr:PQQ-dependent sugar dehydrogenase [Salinarimonas ramus]GGK37516.1 sorbosone dehydrogenase [Salinarimonas ramus]
MTNRIPHLAAASALAILAAGAAHAQGQAAAPGEGAVSPAIPAFQDQAIGKRFQVEPADLPAPQPDEAVRNAALTVSRDGRTPTVPEGFEVALFAEIEGPRKLFVLESGDLLVARQSQGDVMFLRDSDGDGSAETISLFARGFQQPYGIDRIESGENAGDVLVADVRGIWRVPYSDGEIRASGPEIFYPSPLSEVPEDERRPQTPMDHFAVTDEGVFGRPIGHTTRSLLRDEDAGVMYVGVGSAGNIAVEAEPRATIQAFDLDGSNQRTYASGTRNPIGMALHPETGELWAIVQERDGLGNELVPDFLTQIEEGGFYGWPYAYAGGLEQPGFAERAPDLVEATITPDLLFEAHSSAMNLAFYDEEGFPEDYRGDAFVALKGSWNRADPTGYKVVRVPFENGEPEGGYENFMTGFWVEGDERAVVWGRPTDVAVMPDGALVVADETSGTLWRVTYEDAPEATGATPMLDMDGEGDDTAQ